MKNKLLLLFTFILISLNTTAHTNKNMYKTYNSYDDYFTFIEDGITFAVFKNGEFDFYINEHDYTEFDVEYLDRNIKISFNSGFNYNSYIEYDRYGAIIQIESVPIYYDYYGRVIKIGRVVINYDYGNLTQIGGLYIHYNHRNRYSHCTGYINNYNRENYHKYDDYFLRPTHNYKVLSHKPYRKHYTPIRHRYSNNRHKKYDKYNTQKRYDNYRTTTSEVPKIRNHRVKSRNKIYYSRNNNTGRRITKRNSNNYTQRNTERATPPTSIEYEKDFKLIRRKNTRINRPITNNSRKIITKRNLEITNYRLPVN